MLTGYIRKCILVNPGTEPIAYALDNLVALGSNSANTIMTYHLPPHKGRSYSNWTERRPTADQGFQHLVPGIKRPFLSVTPPYTGVGRLKQPTLVVRLPDGFET